VERSAEREGIARRVLIAAGTATLEGDLCLPVGAREVVLFAHGSGSSRHSPRNRHMARLLNEAKLATLLLDLLTPDEETVDLRTGHFRFDIGFLAARLIAATDWLGRHRDTEQLRIGYFGASTGAPAAMMAAAEQPHVVGAIVSRGGRPELADRVLPRVRAPTLLIVGGNDTMVIELNRAALVRLRCEKELVVIRGATHLFEEPGTLDAVALFARAWFESHLVPAVAEETIRN
jgi:dienelactone hydrolase